MKLTPEIYTDKLEATISFYCDYLGCYVNERAEGFARLTFGTDRTQSLMICMSNSPFVNELFHPPFKGHGLILELEVHDIKAIRDGMPAEVIALDIIDEPFNGTHFTVRDPNGVLIDIVQQPMRGDL